MAQPRLAPAGSCSGSHESAAVGRRRGNDPARTQGGRGPVPAMARVVAREPGSHIAYSLPVPPFGDWPYRPQVLQCVENLY